MTNAFTPSAGPGAFQTLSALVLGSSSPRRRELLGSLGLEFEVCPSNAAEPPPEPGEAPEAYARRMARMKTLDVASLYPTATVLGADTIVVLPGHPDAIVLGKPADADDALRMLSPADKAGAYAIQGLGAFLVERVVGSYTNVVGLPVTEVSDILASYGIIFPRRS